MNQQLTHHQIQWKEQRFPLIVACDNWKDPLNVGAAFRLADAFGVAELWLGGTTPAPPNKRIHKTARSADKWIPFRVIPDLGAFLSSLERDTYLIAGVEITTESRLLQHAFTQNGDMSKTVVLVAGAENEGLSVSVINTLHTCVHIPMYGHNSSLNVATALAVTLYEVTNRLHSL
ncbi:MAG: TrmH family RNA methyltransferase [Saprospiraceae bacterium]